MKRLVTQKKKKNVEAYPDELHYFPMTLKFYSAKAYTYVRKTFNLGFPDLSTISKWYRVISGKPGFTEEQLTALKAKVLAGKEKGQKVVCSLMLDEMSICKHAQYDGTKVLGYVDLGVGITDNSPPVATKALDVYTAISVNSNWKIPCSYF